MILNDLGMRVLARLDQPGGSGSYTYAEAISAINEGQRLFVLLTLCLETTAAFTLQGGTPFYHMLTTFPDWILPLRVYLPNGTNIRPARLDDLDSLDSGWTAAAGTPSRYAALGVDFLAVYPQPASATIVNVTYARSPLLMVADGDTPEIPEPYHPALVDFGVYRLRFRDGAQEFEKTLGYFRRFLDEAKRFATYVRARNLGGRYDKLPFELERFDMSRLLTVRPDLLPARQEVTQNG